MPMPERVNSNECRDHRAVVQQILVAQHHPLGRAGRTGRVLQEGQHVGADARILPGVFQSLGKRIDAQPMDVLQQRGFRQQRLDALVNAFQRQRHGGFGIGGDGLDAIELAIHAGRIGRYGDHAGIQAAKKCADEVQSGGKQQQGPLALQSCAPEPGGNGPRPAIEFGKGDFQLFFFPIDEEAIGRI